MPKGDRLKLKADPEDGTTPIANLLLEAVAMAKLSGLQKGAILYLWRKTYGWVGEDGKRKKMAPIGLTEWADALNSIKSSVATALSDLERKNIVGRTNTAWQTYTYHLNTNIAEWNSGCINLTHLSHVIQLAPTVQYGLPPQSDVTTQSDPAERTVSPDRTLQLGKTVLPTLLKERVNKDKESGTDKVITKPRGVTNVPSEPPSFITGLQRTTEAVEQAKKLRRYPIEIAPLRKQVITGLKSRRGYASPQPIPEADAISKMLVEKYTPDQILLVWDEMSKEPFWSDNKMECTMMSVRKQIGAHLRYQSSGKAATPATPQKRGRVQDYPPLN